jgi:hypothetical protein
MGFVEQPISRCNMYVETSMILECLRVLNPNHVFFKFSIVKFHGDSLVHLLTRLH